MIGKEKLPKNIKKDLKLNFGHSGELGKVYVWITQWVLQSRKFVLFFFEQMFWEEKGVSIRRKLRFPYRSMVYSM